MAFGLGLPLTSAVCAKLMAIMAVAPTIEPDERSMPPEMMTCVTPIAMMPTIGNLQDDDVEALLVEEPGDIVAHVEQEAVADDQPVQDFENRQRCR